MWTTDWKLLRTSLLKYIQWISKIQTSPDFVHSQMANPICLKSKQKSGLCQFIYILMLKFGQTDIQFLPKSTGQNLSLSKFSSLFLVWAGGHVWAGVHANPSNKWLQFEFERFLKDTAVFVIKVFQSFWIIPKGIKCGFVVFHVLFATNLKLFIFIQLMAN